jgi:hypothetical protein
MRWLMLCLGLAAATPGTAIAQADAAAELRRAEEALAAARTEDAITILTRLAEESAPRVSSLLRQRADLLLGSAYVSLGQADSAQRWFAALVRQDPLFEVDTLAFNPNVVSAFTTARSSTPAVRIVVPSDTVIRPDGGALPVTIGVGRSGDVTVSLRSGARDSSVKVTQVSRASSLALSLMVADSMALEAGDYLLVATYRSQEGDSATSTQALTIEHIPADTVLPPRPLEDQDLRPESRQGGPVIGSLIKGVLFGAAAVGVPALLASSELHASTGTPALVIGGSLTIAGLVGVFAGRAQIPITENIEYNARLRRDWEEQHRQALALNDHRRRMAPLRIRTRVP